ncbi:FadR/GntR family transcriptional regulator [Amycolatopsis thermoflava]|uniref:FadR/GntR family transcriptional regulator n=1 Tax=Amycolatopsis thermoflava TaxID=84480 RepID=UPI0004104043|nr:GntR family transcriptional regulator [Amycolatopsis thermoflava]
MTAYDELAEHIRHQILTGELKPGDRLPPDSEISEHYRVSRGTAREAQRVLASQGWLKIKRGLGGGVFVVLPGPPQIADSLQTGLLTLLRSDQIAPAAFSRARRLLEVPAAGFAAVHRDANDIVEIKATLAENGGRGPTAAARFHVALLHAAHDPLIETLGAPVLNLALEHDRQRDLPAHIQSRIDEQHQEILGYVEVQDQAGARESTRAHLAYLEAVLEHDHPV